MTTFLIVIITVIFIIRQHKELKHTKQLLNEVYEEAFDFEINMYENFICRLKELVNTYQTRQTIKDYAQKIVELEEIRKYFTKSTTK